eukprot:6037408-Ditylum_brightwellii.AAC.1
MGGAASLSCRLLSLRVSMCRHFGRRYRKGRLPTHLLPPKDDRPKWRYFDWLVHPCKYQRPTKVFVSYWVAATFITGSALFVLGAACSLNASNMTTAQNNVLVR